MANFFVEELFDLGVHYATDGGVEFVTHIVSTPGGEEQRDAKRGVGLGRWNLGDKRLNEEERGYVIEFFRSKRGRHRGFRFRDYAEDTLTDEIIGFGDGSTTLFPVLKSYNTASLVVEQRPIKKLDLTVTGVAKVNGVAVATAYNIDPNIGVIDFLADPPAIADIVTYSGRFHVPVRFDTDKLSMEFEAMDTDSGRKFFNVGALPIVEIIV